jgi:hypothetical protein
MEAPEYHPDMPSRPHEYNQTYGTARKAEEDRDKQQLHVPEQARTTIQRLNGFTKKDLNGYDAGSDKM